KFALHFLLEIVQKGNVDFCFCARAEGYLNFSLGEVLMDAVIRKASEAFVLLESKTFGFVRGRSTHYHVGDLPEVHRNTPNFNLRKRAGDAPCPVPMVCIGSPLPQLGVPQSRHWRLFPIASQDFQKSGVIPAYVQFFSKRTRLPPLISCPISVPNRRFRRLS